MFKHVLILLMVQATFADTKVDNPLISSNDAKEEKIRYAAKRAKEKIAEKAARAEWKKIDQFDKEQSPWSNWYRKSLIPALLHLSKIRKSLYNNNLFDLYIDRPNEKIVCSDKEKRFRRIDGKCNDLSDPSMGAKDTRFGRNTDPRLKTSNYDILYPNPREVSKVLLERDSFKKVPFLNLIAVGWIQFMTHDWFSHGDNLSSVESAPFYLPLATDDELGDLLIFPRSTADASMSAKERELFGQSFQNEVTHWWDASQIYGSSLKTANSLRSFQDGQLKLGQNGQLPLDSDGIEDTGFKRNWWLGLSILHNLFTKEHNFIANRLKDNYPQMSDEELYQTARLINAALLAKIHTIEWTPAILPSSYMRSGMRANWSGLANKGGTVKPWYEFFKSDFLFGIVGGHKTLADVPFAMTEEFVSVYRMHPLLPDFLKLTKINDTQFNQTLGLNEVREEKVANIYKDFKMEDVLYSFGQMHPGQLVLNNYPKSLMNMEIPLVAKMDLAAMDILRDRERGVPRYNEFRRQMQLKPIKSFEELSSNPKHVKKLKEIYNNDIEALDLLVGSLAESVRPTGFGFGETSFQVFIVMASRRLAADRFYTTSYNEDTYTAFGINYIDTNNMKTILLRHYPQLRKALFGVRNAFNPWNSERGN